MPQISFSHHLCPLEHSNGIHSQNGHPKNLYNRIASFHYAFIPSTELLIKTSIHVIALHYSMPPYTDFFRHLHSCFEAHLPRTSGSQLPSHHHWPGTPAVADGLLEYSYCYSSTHASSSWGQCSGHSFPMSQLKRRSLTGKIRQQRNHCC